MIAANKKFLKANLTQGVLEIQTNLIELYTNNLSEIATQAALIAVFSFTAVSEPADVEGEWRDALEYIYTTFFTVCLVCALFVLSQATTTVLFGPTMALKGATDEAVKFAAGHMMQQQLIVLHAAAWSISSLFFASCVLAWALYPYGLAIITTLIYFTGYYFVVKEGWEAYRIFVPQDSAAFIEPDGDHNKSSSTTTVKGSYKAVSGSESKQDQQQGTTPPVLAAAQEATKFKLRAILWKRQSIEDGGLFVKYFAVLEKGRLDFYQKENDYRESLNPINDKPIKLWQFDLESDYRKYSKQVTSLTSAVKSSVMGNEDFAMSDLLSSEYDLQFASRNYKFGLVPKVQSELVASTVHELLAHDEKSYRTWIHALSTVMKGYDDIAANPSVEQTIRVGTADVETVVQAANNRV